MLFLISHYFAHDVWLTFRGKGAIPMVSNNSCYVTQQPSAVMRYIVIYRQIWSCRCNGRYDRYITIMTVVCCYVTITAVTFYMAISWKQFYFASLFFVCIFSLPQLLYLSYSLKVSPKFLLYSTNSLSLLLFAKLRSSLYILYSSYKLFNTNDV